MNIFQIRARYGEYDSYSDVLVYTTLDIDDAQARNAVFVKQVKTIFAMYSVGEELLTDGDMVDDCARRATWDGGLELVIVAVPLGMVDCGTIVSREYMKCHDQYYTDHEAVMELMYDLPKPTDYEILAQPFERKYLGWRIN